MSRLPPTSTRLSSGALLYPMAGSSSAYFERQLKQNLANMRAWSPSVSLFYTIGRFSRIRRKLLVHSCVNPITGPLRSRSHFELMLVQSYAWYLSKFRGVCGGLGLVRSAAQVQNGLNAERADRGIGGAATNYVVSPRRNDKTIGSLGMSLTCPQFTSTLGRWSSAVNAGSKPVRYRGTADLGVQNVGLKAAHVYATAPTQFSICNLPKQLRHVGGRTKSTQLYVLEAAVTALKLFSGASRRSAGLGRVNRRFDLGAWVGKPNLGLPALSITEPRHESPTTSETVDLSYKQVLSLDAGQGVGLGRRPCAKSYTCDTHYVAHGPVRRSSGALRKRVDELDLRSVYAVNPSPRLAFVRSYNKRTTLVKFSLTSGHHQRQASQRLMYRNAETFNRHNPETQAGLGVKRQQRVKVQALTSSMSSQNTRPSSAVIKCGFVRSKSRFTMGLARPESAVAPYAFDGSARATRGQPTRDLSLRL